jgi:hypothetical protein
MTAVLVSWTPSAPTNVSSTSYDRQINLNWAGPANNGGYAV